LVLLIDRSRGHVDGIVCRSRRRSKTGDDSEGANNLSVA